MGGRRKEKNQSKTKQENNFFKDKKQALSRETKEKSRTETGAKSESYFSVKKKDSEKLLFRV